MARIRIRIWLWWLRLAVSRGADYRQSILVGSVLRLRGVLLMLTGQPRFPRSRRDRNHKGASASVGALSISQTATWREP